MRAVIAFLTAALFCFRAPRCAQEIDWQQSRCDVREKACGVGRRSSLRFSTNRSFGDARWRHNQANAGARRLGGIQASAWWRDDYGRLVLLESEINPVMAKLIEGGTSDHSRSQPLAAREPCDFLHACRRTRRPGQDGGRYSRRTVCKQNAASLPQPRPLRRRP